MQRSYANAFSLLIAVAFIVSACSTNDRIGGARVETPATLALATPPAKRELHFPFESLNYENAQAILESEPALFASASALAAQRPLVHKEIAQFVLDHIDADGKVEIQSIINFQPLPGGLEFTRHTAPASTKNSAIEESSINIFGIASVLYQNKRIQDAGDKVPFTEPDQIRLLGGKLFSMTSSFSLETRTGAGTIVVMDCTPAETIPAQRLHPSLFGHAEFFNCRAPSIEITERLVYLEETARYISLETHYGDDLLSHFKISDVTYR